METIRNCNNLIQENKPWLLLKSDLKEDHSQLDKIIFIVYETLRIAGILLQPIIPSLSVDLLERLNVQLEGRHLINARVNKGMTKEEPINMNNLKKNVLFKRIL